MYRYSEFDSVVQCPYDINHKIARSRIQRHLVKCEKNYPEDHKLLCPYDATHRLSKKEMEDHVLTCPMRQMVEPIGNDQAYAYGWVKSGQLLIESNMRNWTEMWDTTNRPYNAFEFTVENEESTQKDQENDNTLCCRPNYDNIKEIDDKEELRPPKGYSETMLRDDDDDTKTEDMESVVSWMGIGRGRAVTSNANLLRRVGARRGRH